MARLLSGTLYAKMYYRLYYQPRGFVLVTTQVTMKRCDKIPRQQKRQTPKYPLPSAEELNHFSMNRNTSSMIPLKSTKIL